MRKTIIYFWIMASLTFVGLTSYAIGDSPPGWSPQNTGSNHTILFPLGVEMSFNGLPLDSGDYIGVFYDSANTLACGGYTMWENKATALPAWGAEDGEDGFAFGEVFKWKVFHQADQKEYHAEAVFDGESFPNYNSYLTNGMSGLISVSAFPSQQIFLEEGWNLIHSKIDDLNSFSELIASIETNLLYLENENELIYIPGENSSLQELASGEAHWVKMQVADTLFLFGVEPNWRDSQVVILPTQNYFSYWGETEQDLPTFFGDEAQHLRIVRNSKGEIYWPELDVQEFVTLYPGCSYEVLLLDTLHLDYSSARKSFFGHKLFLNSFYYDPIPPGNHCMYLSIKEEAWDSLPGMNDEIGVYDSFGTLITSASINNGRPIVLLWEDDPSTLEKDGLIDGETFYIKKWDGNTGFEDLLEIELWEEGDSIYQRNKVSLIGKMKTTIVEEDRDFALNVFQSFSQHQLFVELTVPVEAAAYLDLFTLEGKELMVLYDDRITPGKHQIEIPTAQLQAGTYLLRFQVRERFFVQKVLIPN